MRTDFSDEASRSFYGSPQHETRPPVDAERVRVVSPSPVPTERELRSYAEWSASEDAALRQSSPERRHALADALRRRCAPERPDGDGIWPSDADARGVMVRW